MQIKNLKKKNIKWWVGIISCITLFVFIAVFGYEKMSFIWKGVEIEATIKQSDNSSIITVEGNASKAIHLTLNGREIFIEKNGDFSESVSVLPGFSIVTLNAKDKFGKTAEKKFELVREENASAIAFQSGEIIKN
ncbi:MAG: hypothetical protein WC603_03940 [Candidatus Paceibacterota bacterium]|jgi:hypothetical protein